MYKTILRILALCSLLLPFQGIAQVERLIAMMNMTLLLCLLPMIRSAPPVPLRTIPSLPTKMERVSLWVP